MPDLGNLLVRVGANIEDFQGAMSAVSTRAGDVAKEVESKFAGFDSIGRTLTGIGANITAGLTLPIAAVGTAAITSAASFELAMRKVTSLIDNVTEGQFRTLYNQTLDMSRAMGVDAVKAADGLYQAISTGIPPDNAVSFLKVASVAAIAGMTDLRTSVDGITTVVQAFGLKASEAGKVADAMFMAVNKGKLEFPELASSIGIAAGSAHILGVSYQELLAAGATITIATGQKIPEAMTQLQSAMKSILKPTKQMSDLIAETGFVSGEALIKAKGLEGGIQAISAAANGSATALIAAYGRIEGFRGSLALTGQNAQIAKEHLDALNNSTGAAQRAFEEIDKATSRQFQRLTTDLKDTAIELGTALLPAVNSLLAGLHPLVDLIKGAVTWFAQLPGSLQGAIVGMAALAAAAGPVLLIMGGMASGFGTLMSGLSLLSGAFLAVTPAVLGFATGAIPAAITAVGTFATVSLPAGVLALGRFSTALLVDAGTALVAFAASVSTNAVAALSTLVLTTLPAASAAFISFATVGIPSAIAAMVTFATTAIPATIAALNQLVVTTIPNLITAFMGLASTAIPYVVASLATIGVAAAAVGAAFAGWQIGQFALSHIPALQRLNDAIGDIAVKIPIIGDALLRWSGVQAITDKSTQDLAASTDKFSKFLAAHGIVVDRGSLSLDDYQKKLLVAAKALKDQGSAATGAATALDGHTKSQAEYTAELKKAQIALAETKRLFKEGAASIEDVQAAMQRVREASAKAHPELKQTGIEMGGLAKATEDYNSKAIKFTAQEITHIAKLSDMQKALESARNEEQQFNDDIRDGQGPLELISHALDDVTLSVDRLAPDMSNLGNVIHQMAAGSVRDLDALGNAFETLGIKTSGSMRQTRDESVAAYKTIVASGVATKGEIEAAWVAMTQAEIAYRRSLGADASQLEIELAKYKDAHASAAKQVGEQWRNLAGDISRNLHAAIEDLFNGKFGLQSILDMFKKIGADIATVMLKPAEDAIAKFIVNGLKPLFESLGSILTRIPLIGTALGSVFGSGGGGVLGTSVGAAGGLGGVLNGGIATVPGGVQTLPGNVGQLGQAGSSAGQSAAGLLGSLASAASIVSAVTGVASGIVAGFQAATQIDLLKLIEASTRFTWITLGQGSESVVSYTKATWMDIHGFFIEYLYTWYHDAWTELLDGITNINDVLKNGIKTTSPDSGPPATTVPIDTTDGGNADTSTTDPQHRATFGNTGITRGTYQTNPTTAGLHQGTPVDRGTYDLRGVVPATTDAAPAPVPTVPTVAVAPAIAATVSPMSADAAYELITVNNTLSGISAMLARSLGIQSAAAAGPVEVMSSTLLDAINRSSAVMTDAIKTAGAMVTGALTPLVQTAVAGGGNITIDMRGSTISNDAAAEDLARKITERLRNVIRR